MMATGWWWWPSSSLPAWLRSEAVWFVALNAVVAAVAILSSRARPSRSSPRRGDAAGVTRRASSALLLQSLLSFSIFSFPSACFSFLQPDAAAAFPYLETEELARSPTKPSPRALTITLTPPPPAPAADEDEEEDPNAMSMDEAYALVLASRQQRPEPEQDEEARRSDVDAKAEDFIRGFNEDLRQQRLNSIFNYTQMLRQRVLAAGRRQQPDASRPDQL